MGSVERVRSSPPRHAKARPWRSVEKLGTRHVASSTLEKKMKSLVPVEKNRSSEAIERVRHGLG
jgi:hypothetical protein